MTETAITPGTPDGLLVPAELAVAEVEATVVAEVSEIVIRRLHGVRTATLIICMQQCQLLAVASIAHCYVHWPTCIVLVIVHAIHSLVSVHLQPQYQLIAISSSNTPYNEYCHLYHTLRHNPA